jgi:hypothetical protein
VELTQKKDHTAIATLFSTKMLKNICWKRIASSTNAVGKAVYSHVKDGKLDHCISPYAKNNSK